GRVHRREHKVPGYRRLDGDLRGLPIAHLADKDDIGILPQDGPQAEGEGELRRRVDLGLVYVLERVLDGVLDRRDVEGRPIELVDRRVDGGGLAATRRCCYADDSVRA